MAGPGRPQNNGLAERLNRTVKEEETRLEEYKSFEQASRSIQEFMRRYNEERVHQALGYKTPREALERWLQDHSKGEILP